VKTRDRILETSLRLFNEQGEAHTTTLDIATELEISPGNLYYHFKGKDQIIAELYEQLELALGETLSAPLEGLLHPREGSVDDNWYFLYVVLEELYQYRFFYHNLDDILHRYPRLQKRFRALVSLKRQALGAIIDGLLEQQLLAVPAEQRGGLIENMTLQLTYWLNYDRLLHDGRPAQLGIHQGVLQLLTMIAPYLGDAELDFYRECQKIYAAAIDGGKG
jgi:AcrR family transcriptional regulator